MGTYPPVNAHRYKGNDLDPDADGKVEPVAPEFKNSAGNVIYRLYYDEAEDAMYWEHVPTGMRMRMI